MIKKEALKEFHKGNCDINVRGFGRNNSKVQSFVKNNLKLIRLKDISFKNGDTLNSYWLVDTRNIQKEMFIQWKEEIKSNHWVGIIDIVMIDNVYNNTNYIQVNDTEKDTTILLKCISKMSNKINILSLFILINYIILLSTILSIIYIK